MTDTISDLLNGNKVTLYFKDDVEEEYDDEEDYSSLDRRKVVELYIFCLRDGKEMDDSISGRVVSEYLRFTDTFVEDKELYKYIVEDDIYSLIYRAMINLKEGNLDNVKKILESVPYDLYPKYSEVIIELYRSYVRDACTNLDAYEKLKDAYEMLQQNRNDELACILYRKNLQKTALLLYDCDDYKFYTIVKDLIDNDDPEANMFLNICTHPKAAMLK